jgi:flagellin
MIINHNIPALNTYRSLTINNENTSKSLAKLSSGLRINSAGDDAAGLAISEKMRSQIRGLNQASRNAYDGKSLLNVAEGALNEVHSILQRMKELAVQSANDTNTTFDREEIQKEVEQLKTEIDRISRDTEFNTMKLLNGTMENKAMIADAEKNNGSFTDKNFRFAINSSAVVAEGKYTLTCSAATSGTANVKYSTGVNLGGGPSGSGDITFHSISTLTGGSTGLGAKFGEYRLDISGNLGGTYDLTLTGPDGKYQTLKAQGNSVTALFDQLGVTIDFGTHTITGDGTVSFSNELTSGAFTLKGTNGDANENIDVKITIGNTGGTQHPTFQTYSGQTIDMGGLQFTLTQGLFSLTTSAANVLVIDNSIKLHIGANEGQNMSVSVLDSSSKALNINKVDLQVQEKADAAISVIDAAINRVSSERSKMGAIVNRLDHTIANLGTTSENMQASESRIRDVDMAKEIMEFTKSQILSQAAQSMLAQANALPQGILQLLQ